MAERSWALGARGGDEWLDSAPRDYASAGVDRDKGSSAVAQLAVHARTTFGAHVLSDIGGFGGMFSLPESSRTEQSLLVASSDGVGTKSLLATATGNYDTIGVDLVAMNIDDIVVYGATPLFLLDYLVVGEVIPAMVESIVSGIAEGCRQVGCALLGGEVAEHPGTMASGEFDLAGFVVGSVDRDAVITGRSITAGDVVVGIAAEGMRSDGYSLVRKVFADSDLDGAAYPGANITLAQELLRPSRIYTPAVLEAISRVSVHGIAHITGGGIATNLSRILPAGCGAILRRGSWPVPPIFAEMMRVGGLLPSALESSLPIGIGMVIVVDRSDAAAVIDVCARRQHDAFVIGQIVSGERGAVFADSGE